MEGTKESGAVSGDTEEHFHHEFTRLHNGHYMVLGNEYVQPLLQKNTTMPADPGNNETAR